MNHHQQLVQVAQTSNEEDLAHPGMVKYGEHWYKEDAMFIDPIDHFADFFN